jgi:hypothetical protein
MPLSAGGRREVGRIATEEVIGKSATTSVVFVTADVGRLAQRRITRRCYRRSRSGLMSTSKEFKENVRE